MPPRRSRRSSQECRYCKTVLATKYNVERHERLRCPVCKVVCEYVVQSYDAFFIRNNSIQVCGVTFECGPEARRHETMCRRANIGGAAHTKTAAGAAAHKSPLTKNTSRLEPATAKKLSCASSSGRRRIEANPKSPAKSEDPDALTPGKERSTRQEKRLYLIITKSTPKCLKSASSSANITADNVGRQLPFYSKRDVSLPRYNYFCLDCENWEAIQ